ncbi:tyrosine-type recombinase/integrase [Vibrio scophthalmi]|uniref:Uncharacterized protein n=1 Tax=Vibrio scophthalmi LMG 19158 TaxID=870967 RepID=F9RQ12_9VIBR|nr:tyrosine-type recombinase/integrase [Vibrio scophthalmi]EGU34614.1 hypothetical protein VIS19158_11258 [Vibrio scophthalmi LMG 19158]
MYLYKSPQGVYYIRICTPTHLKALGYPFDFKISLLTKTKQQAHIDGFKLVSQIKLILHACPALSFVDFKRYLLSLLDAHRNQDVCLTKLPSNLPDKKTCKLPDRKVTDSEAQDWIDALDTFITSKQQEGVTPLTCHQLNQRVTAFFDRTGIRTLKQVTTATLMKYVTHLNASELSTKSCREYYAALTQFLRWCAGMGLIERNAAADISPRFKQGKKASEQRSRWTIAQLNHLVRSDAFQCIDRRFQWVTLLLTYQGLRPSEACQLRTQDVLTNVHIPHLSITDKGNHQRLKNSYTIRRVPIHHRLIELGFIEYVNERQTSRRTQLFDYKPSGLNDDWSRQYCTQFGSLLTQIGFKAGHRPTAYSLRHTFIDILKQQGAPESTVADIVGHQHASMTYGRYGKRTTLQSLAEVVNQFTFDGEHEDE